MSIPTDPTGTELTILDATSRLIISSGITAATVRAIAAEANVSSTTVQSYGVGDLRRRALSRHTETALQRLASTESGGDSPLEDARALVRSILPISPEGLLEEHARQALQEMARKDHTETTMTTMSGEQRGSAEPEAATLLDDTEEAQSESPRTLAKAARESLNPCWAAAARVHRLLGITGDPKLDLSTKQLFALLRGLSTTHTSYPDVLPREEMLAIVDAWLERAFTARGSR